MSKKIDPLAFETASKMQVKIIVASGLFGILSTAAAYVFAKHIEESTVLGVVDILRGVDVVKESEVV